ncbi:MAG: hypothetical protein AB7F89_12485 [Pirellulaceae bacterium]
MRIDVRQFAQTNAIDTCAIWNVLSSARLTSAALGKQRWFVVADYVRYEALERPRTSPEPSELELQEKFRQRLERTQGFSRQSISMSDLQAVANIPVVSRLGRGEIAALALARKMRIGFMTDDQKARAGAPEVGAGPAHTTPHLLGWLIYDGALGDGDVGIVIVEHEGCVPNKNGQLTKFFKAAYEEACRCRLARDHAMSGAPAGQ